MSNAVQVDDHQGNPLGQLTITEAAFEAAVQWTPGDGSGESMNGRLDALMFATKCRMQTANLIPAYGTNAFSVPLQVRVLPRGGKARGPVMLPLKLSAEAGEGATRQLRISLPHE